MSIERTPQQPEEETFKDPEINEILREFNFDTLRDIFEGFAVKSGVDPAEIGFVEPEEIKRGNNLKSLILHGGGYDPIEKDINLVEGSLNMASRTKTDKKAVVLSTLVHEEVHALGHAAVEEHEEDVLFGLIQRKMTNAKTGSMEVQTANTFNKEIYVDSQVRWFNEGMVDQLASEVYEEYLHREQPEPLNEEKSLDFFSGYPLARLFVRTLKDRLAEESGLPEEVVWGSFVRLYIEGDSIVSEEVQESLSEVFSEKFFARLSGINAASQNPIQMSLAFKEVLTKESVNKILSELKEHLAAELAR